MWKRVYFIKISVWTNDSTTPYRYIVIYSGGFRGFVFWVFLLFFFAVNLISSYKSIQMVIIQSAPSRGVLKHHPGVSGTEDWVHVWAASPLAHSFTSHYTASHHFLCRCQGGWSISFHFRNSGYKIILMTCRLTQINKEYKHHAYTHTHTRKHANKPRCMGFGSLNQV